MVLDTGVPDARCHVHALITKLVVDEHKSKVITNHKTRRMLTQIKLVLWYPM